MTYYRAICNEEKTDWFELDPDWMEYDDWKEFMLEIMNKLDFSFYNCMYDWLSYGNDDGHGRVADYLHMLDDDTYDEFCVDFLRNVVFTEASEKEFYGLRIEESEEEDIEDELEDEAIDRADRKAEQAREANWDAWEILVKGGLQ